MATLQEVRDYLTSKLHELNLEHEYLLYKLEKSDRSAETIMGLLSAIDKQEEENGQTFQGLKGKDWE